MEDLPPDVNERLADLPAEMERIDGLRHVYEKEEITRGGAFVVLNCVTFSAISHDRIGTYHNDPLKLFFLQTEGERYEPEHDTVSKTILDFDE